MRVVFVDVDTQKDFVYPSGALYVPGAENIIPTVAKLNKFAAEHGIPLISTTDAHIENDPEFQQWPPHCVVGTEGQKKPEETLVEPRVTIPPEKTAFELGDAKQIIVQKRALDVFTNPNFPELLNRLNADKYVVYGVVTEICVRHAALGLLKTGKPVELVTDAVKELKPEDRDRFFEEFQKLGGKLTTSEQVMKEALVEAGAR